MKIHCKHDQLVDPKTLKNHPKNRNKHGQDQIDRLAELYKYHGIRHPIIVSNLSKCIVAGHGRKLAAIRADIKEMPVVYQDFESTEAEYAFIQADNAIALWAELDLAGINADIGDLGPDFDINMLGIHDFTLDVAEKDFEGDPDEVPEEVEPVAKLGQIYKLGEHRLMCGDSTDEATVSQLMNGEKADMVFTDPPYGIRVVKNNQVGGGGATKFGGKIGKVVQSSTYKPIEGDDTTEAAKICYEISVDLNIDTLIFWGGNYFTDFLPPKPCWLVWDKQNTGNFADVELAWVNKTTGAKLYKWLWNGLARKGERKTELSTRVHPTQKPVGLFELVFKDFKGEKVLDFFGGSGSTLIACEKTNRKCFMMELDPHYVSVIVERWRKFTGKEACLLNDDGTETPWESLCSKK